MSSSRRSDQAPFQLPGYDYDPVLNRYFKSTSSALGQLTATGSKVEKSNQVIHHQDGPPSFRLRKPQSILTRREFDPEMEPGSVSKRSRHRSRVRYGPLCSKSAQPVRLSGSPSSITSNSILYMTTTSTGAEGSCPTLLVAATQTNVLISKLAEVLDSGGYHMWAGYSTHHNMIFGQNETLTSIVGRPGLLGLATTKNFAIANIVPVDPPYLPDMKAYISFHDSAWCMCFTSRYVLSGGSKAVHSYDYLNNKTVSAKISSAVLAIEEKDELVFLLGTRSGKLLNWDLRSPLSDSRDKLISGHAIHHVKQVNEHEILVVATMNHAKLYDTRYLRSRTPTMNLDGYQNVCDPKLGVTLSDDKHLVCMPSEDGTIKIWDLKSEPRCGFGLQPIVEHETKGTVFCAMFVDQLLTGYCRQSRPSSQNSVGYLDRRPAGPGLLFADGNELYWLAHPTDSSKLQNFCN